PPPGSPPGRSFGPPHSDGRGSERRMDLPTRDNALALLQKLMSDEQHLSKLLVIKDESRDLNRLVKNISETADHVADRLKPFERKDHRRDRTDLPPGEVATRESITQMKR